jgi:hypothetical protein
VEVAGAAELAAQVQSLAQALVVVVVVGAAELAASPVGLRAPALASH